MDSVINQLSQYLIDKLDHTPSPTRILVGIAGIPASGKSTVSLILAERINQLLESHLPTNLNACNAEGAIGKVDNQPQESKNVSQQDRAILVGLDGWHYSRAQLDLFPDPKQAHDRRGIHWTFDATSYVAFVRKLRDTATVNLVSAPSFDHALKDPTPDAVIIHPHHRIVIIEGLYTFLDIQPWSEAGLLLDERWFIDVDLVHARRRLVQRHVLTGVTKDVKEAEWRADTNDGPNGEFIIQNMLRPTRTILSIETATTSKDTVEVAFAPVDDNST